MHLYPEAAGHFFRGLAGVARRKAELLVDLYRELDLVPLTLIGTDLCGRDGPLISPEFLREFYFPHVRHSLEPFREAGIRTVWHSDACIEPVVTDVLSCGVSGFQGFQLEYGVDVEAIAGHRTLDGERLVIFAGPSTAATLSRGTPGDVRREVDFLIDTLARECALFILPANNILPDCPAGNIVEMYRRAADYSRRGRTEGSKVNP
jgi:uroporphyrinogen decarboxylase